MDKREKALQERVKALESIKPVAKEVRVREPATHSALVVSSPDLESLYKILGEYAKKSEFGDYTHHTDRDDIIGRLNRLEKRQEA